MGKPKSKTRTKAAAKKPAAAAKATAADRQTTTDYSIDDILKQVEACMDEYKYELAQKFCERALEMDADNVRALELTSSLLLELGQMESAQHCLGRAVFLEPHTGHSKYLSLAQLMTGPESRDLYRKAIEILTNLLTGQEASDPVKAAEWKRDLSNAHVSISEIYMTDLCDEQEAESESKSSIERSIECDPSNPESFQAKANYALVTGNIEEAKLGISQSIALWFPQQLQFLENGEGIETTLSYTFRLNTAKILLDLEQYDTAIKLLESLLEEDDQVVSAWYLLGWLYYLRSRSESDYAGNARHYLLKAAEVNKANPTEDRAMVDHIQELLKELAEAGEGDEEVAAAVDIADAEAGAVAQLLDEEATEDGEDSRMEG